MASFGETLRRERELRDISLREISDATKINIRYLEALEQNRFDVLPGGLFNKGFIRAYARYIGVDGEAMVDRYLTEIASPEEHAPELGAGPPPIHRPAETPRRRADHQEAAAPGVAHAQGGAPAHGTSHAQGGATAHGSAPAHGSTPASGGPPSPSIRFAESQPPRRESATPVRLSVPPPQPVRTATAAALAAVLEAPRGSPHPSAVTAIEPAVPADPGSRVLSWILALVGGAAVLFLVLSLVMRREAPSPRSAAAGSGSHGAAAGRPDSGGGRAPSGPVAPPPAGRSADGPAAGSETRAAAGPESRTADSGTRTAAGSGAKFGTDSGTQPGTDSGTRTAADSGTRTSPAPASRTAPAPETRIAAGSAAPAPARRRGEPEPQAPPRKGRGEENADADDAALAAAQGARDDEADAVGAGRRGPMELQVETTDSTWVQVICDARTAINRVMLEGEAENLTCLGLIRVSTINAGAVRLSVNGSPCLSLGDDGKRVYGYTIRIDDFSRICPGSRRGGDGRD